MRNMLKYRYPIAVHMDEKEVCAVQLKETRNGIEIRELLSRELDGKTNIPVEGNKALVAIFKEISKNKRFGGKRVVAHLPYQKIFNFPIHFHVQPDESVEAAILRESEEYLPFPLEQGVIDYPSIIKSVDEDSDRYKATVIATRLDDIKQYLRLFKQARLTLEAVDFAVSSLMRLHDYLYKIPNEPIILCHIGRTRCLLSVVKQDDILGDLVVPWGTDRINRKIQANLELKQNSNMPKILLKKYGLSFECRDRIEKDTEFSEDILSDDMCRTLYQIISPSIEEFIDEVHKIMGYVRSDVADSVFEGIYIYGQGSIIRCMDNYLEARLNIPVKLINPMTKEFLQIDGFPAEIFEDTTYALALGLAMRKVTWL